jgi:hypothetical protein
VYVSHVVRSEILVLLHVCKGACCKRGFRWMPFCTFDPKADLTLSCMEQTGWDCSSGKAKFCFGLKCRICYCLPPPPCHIPQFLLISCYFFLVMVGRVASTLVVPVCIVQFCASISWQFINYSKDYTKI